MATYIVGDIQACFSGLQRLLQKVDFSPSSDRLIAVGDLIGRGAQPLETLSYLYSLEGSFETVLGNHDLHLLAIYAGIRKAKPADNLETLLTSPKLTTYINWLREKPLALMANEDTLVTHAGLYPQWSVKKALKVSLEVNQQLQGNDWKCFIADMYGNQPSVWSKSLQGAQRLRFIVNAMTRMRFIDDKNRLEFTCSTSPHLAPSHLTPWFNMPNPHLKMKQKVVFGHWASLMGNTQMEQFCALDTGYIWGQSMSLLKLCSGELFSIAYQG